MITATSKGSKKILSVFLPSPPLRDTSFLLGDMVLVHLFLQLSMKEVLTNLLASEQMDSYYMYNL